MMPTFQSPPRSFPLTSSPLTISFLLLAFSSTASSFAIVKPASFSPWTKKSLHRFEDRRRLAMSSSEDDGVASEFPTKEELDAFLAVAIDASKKAGEIIVGNSGGVEVSEVKANSRDLLTLIDPLCEKIIRETVLEVFPSHSFLGEEDVPPGAAASASALSSILSSSSSPYLWIVDPIDGTTNFVHGMPLCMPSVALSYKGQIVVGVIYDPHRNELFHATKGGGSYLNNQKIKVGDAPDLGSAVIAMGSPPAEFSYKMSLKGIQVLMPKVRTLRMLGSAALMLAWVANGRLTGYWEYDLSSWDVSAGALIIWEAGGKFTDLKGEDWTLEKRKIVATNGGNVHTELLEVLNTAGVI